jgi:hypothetical protein
MPIRFSEPPPNVRSKLVPADASAHATPHAAFLAQVPGRPAEASWTMPHEIYHLGLNAITSGDGIDKAEPVAWRYLTGEPENVPYAAEVHTDAQQHKYVALNEGPFVRGFAEQIQSASSDPDVERGDYEPRLLQVPALYVVATWLKDRNSGAETFIPLEPSNPAVTPGRRYSRVEFEAALAEAAKKPERPPTAVKGTPGSQAP